MFTMIKKLAVDEDGATMVEYAVLLGLITLVSIAIITTLGTSVKNVFTGVNASVAAA
jgi:pilus assembly protein Flp/PilA